MPRSITLEQHALYDEETGTLEPIPAGYKLVRANDSIAMADGGDVADRFLESVNWRRRSITDVPGSRLHRLPRDIPTPVPTDEGDGESDEPPVDEAEREPVDQPLVDEPRAPLPEDKGELLALLDLLSPDHDYDKRYGVETLQEAVRAAGG